MMSALRLAMVCVPLLLTAACGSADEAVEADPAGAVGETAVRGPVHQRAQERIQAGTETRASDLSIENDDYKFRYAWPQEADDIPALKDSLGAERDTQKARLEAEAATGRKEAEGNDFPYHPLVFLKQWDVVTDLPRFLSLSAEIYTYSGGAHGMSVFDALIWDREGANGGKALKPLAMFRSAAALNDAVRARFCAQLDKARARKRGGPVTRSEDSFNDCIEPVANSTVILGSSTGDKFDRIGFLIPPYNAGPYSEGAYEVTVPANDTVMDAVKSQYRPYFEPSS